VRAKSAAATKAELSRDAVVDRALALADEEGLAAVTIRRLAQEFGVTPMALYWHVSNKDELFEAMGDRFYAGMRVDEIASTGPWPEQLRRMIAALVAVLRAHPAAAHLAAQRILQCEPGRDIAERALGLLRHAGFSTSQAADIAGHAMQTALMLVVEQPGEPTVAVAERAAVMEGKRRALESLPPQRYPNLVAAAGALTDCDDEDAYLMGGIDLFVAGVEALQSARPARQTPAR
jgi:AcrR family transcriptional regulator